MCACVCVFSCMHVYVCGGPVGDPLPVSQPHLSQKDTHTLWIGGHLIDLQEKRRERFRSHPVTGADFLLQNAALEYIRVSVSRLYMFLEIIEKASGSRRLGVVVEVVGQPEQV